MDNSPEKLEAVEQMQTAARASRQPMHVHFPLQKNQQQALLEGWKKAPVNAWLKQGTRTHETHK